MTSSSGKMLFKYSSPESKYFLHELKHQNIYFSSPSQFNDPFDCQMEYKRLLNEALRYCNVDNSDFEKRVSSMIDKVLKNVGICCFSRARKNQLMWSHYASKHEGICFGFNKAAFSRSIPLSSSEDVVYGSKHPLKDLDGHLSILAEDSSLSETDAFQVVIKSLISVKYTYWQYERETRLAVKKYGNYSFDSKALKSVAVGLKIKPDTKKELHALLSLPQWRHVALFQAKKSNEKYALEFDNIKLNQLLLNDS